MQNIPQPIRRLAISLALSSAVLMVPVLAHAKVTTQDISFPMVVSKSTPKLL